MRVNFAVLFLQTFLSSTFSSTSQSFFANKYDRKANVFSPNGELLQVRYAELASEKGECVLCSIAGENVIIMTKAHELDPLLDRRSIDKVQRIDDSIWMSFSGLAGDGRALVRASREFCLTFRHKYGCSASVGAVANCIADLQHDESMKDDGRPYGATCVFCGYDSISGGTSSTASSSALSETSTSSSSSDTKNKPLRRPKIFTVRPSGLVDEWKSVAIGKNQDAAMKELEDEYTCFHLDPITSTTAAVAMMAKTVGATLMRTLLRCTTAGGNGGGYLPGSETPDDEKEISRVLGNSAYHEQQGVDVYLLSSRSAMGSTESTKSATGVMKAPCMNTISDVTSSGMLEDWIQSILA